MNTKNLKKAKLILIIYLAATLLLLFLGYSVQKPKITQQEFPFTITYTYQGETKTISDVYVGEYVRRAKYLGDDSVVWNGYIKDHNRLESDFYRIAELEGQAFSINLNIDPGHLMGDPDYADFVCEPAAVYHGFDGMNDITVTDPAELDALGFSVLSWEYPEPIENSFSFGGISLSSEAAVYTAVIALAALLACMALIKRDREIIVYGKMDKAAIVLNFLIAIGAFPFILITSILSEIVADISVCQQILYFAPALTLLGLALSVTGRRLGRRHLGFWSQFAGPLIFVLLIFIVQP